MTYTYILSQAPAFLQNPQTRNAEDGTGYNWMDEIIQIGATGALKFFDWGILGITILFLVGIITMIMAMIFKNGQWQKYSQLTMFWSFVTMLILRGVPLIIFSTRSGSDIDESFDVLITAISQLAIFVGFLGITVSLLFKFGNHLIEHPEFYRWSKNVRNVSIVMMIFALTAPTIFALL